MKFQHKYTTSCNKAKPISCSATGFPDISFSSFFNVMGISQTMPFATISTGSTRFLIVALHFDIMVVNHKTSAVDSHPKAMVATTTSTSSIKHVLMPGSCFRVQSGMIGTALIPFTCNTWAVPQPFAAQAINNPGLPFMLFYENG
jgi:hypothetical protein